MWAHMTVLPGTLTPSTIAYNLKQLTATSLISLLKCKIWITVMNQLLLNEVAKISVCSYMNVCELHY